MSHLRRICLIAILLLPSVLVAETTAGVLFIKNTNGTLTVDGKAVGLHTTIDPVGKRIALSGDAATLVFSNSMALVLEPNTVLTVDKFQQDSPSEFLVTDNGFETSRSDLVITLERGGFITAQSKPRATSVLTIKLPTGTLTGSARSLAVSLDSVPPEVAILSGTLRLERNNDVPVTLQTGQWLDLDKARVQSRGVLLEKIEDERLLNYAERRVQAERMRDMLIFTYDDGEWLPSVVVPRDFVDQSAKNDYLIR